MRYISNSMIRAGIFSCTLLSVGFVYYAAFGSRCVEASSCEETFTNFTNANWAYSNAFQSYYYGVPTTCQQQCQNSQNPNCISDCQISRHTALAQADTALFTAAWATCTPITVDECDQARAMADDCAIQHNYLDYPNQEERLAIFAQYSACMLASKVSACQ